MVHGREHNPDPLRVRRNLPLTIVTVKVANGSGSVENRYACVFSGTGKNEQVTVLGKIVGDFGTNVSGASVAARKSCQRGTPVFVAMDTKGTVYVVEELDAGIAQEVGRQILAERKGQRSESFRPPRSTPPSYDRLGTATGNGSASGNGTASVDPIEALAGWAQDIALRYVDKPTATVRNDAVDELPGLCGADASKRTALVAAFRAAAELYEDDASKASALRQVASDLEKGNLVLVGELRREIQPGA